MKYLSGQHDVRQENHNAFIFTHERSTLNYEIYSTAINGSGDRFHIWIPGEMARQNGNYVPRWFNAFCAKEEGPTRTPARKTPPKRRKKAKTHPKSCKEYGCNAGRHVRTRN